MKPHLVWQVAVKQSMKNEKIKNHPVSQIFSYAYFHNYLLLEELAYMCMLSIY